MTEMLLLGAGASKDAGLPDAYGLTKEILNRFENNFQLRKAADILRFVIGGLLFQVGCRGQNPLDSGVNVEDLFNAVQLLADRGNLEAAPFIGSWHALVDKFDRSDPPRAKPDRIHRIIFESVAKLIKQAFSSPPSSSESDRIDRTLQNTIRTCVEAIVKGRNPSFSSSDGLGRAVSSYLKDATDRWQRQLSTMPSSADFVSEFERAIKQEAAPAGGKPFTAVNEYMIRTLADIIWIEQPERVAYLRPILNCVRRQQRLVIASLNYDNAVERLAEGSSGVCSCTTGIEDWSRTGSLQAPDNGIFLLKLHGSIDWKYQHEIPEGALMPQIIVKQVGAGEMQQPGYRPAVIFGQRNKLTAEGPFLDLLQSFRRELTVADRVTVIGYSFRDEHINVFLAQWLNQSKSRRLRIVSRSFTSSRIKFAELLQRFAKGQIEIVDAWAADGLLQIFPD